MLRDRCVFGGDGDGGKLFDGWGRNGGWWRSGSEDSGGWGRAEGGYGRGGGVSLRARDSLVRGRHGGSYPGGGFLDFGGAFGRFGFG